MLKSTKYALFIYCLISGPPPPSNIRVTSSTKTTILLEWDDECEDNPEVMCDNDRTTSEYVIKYNVAGGNVYTRPLEAPASQYNLDEVNANNQYEITMMIVAKESNVYSDQSQIVVGTTSKLKNWITISCLFLKNMFVLEFRV